MQVNTFNCSQQSGTYRLQVMGKFLRINNVPSGNTLSFKTSSGETFQGTTGDSIEFDGEFKFLEVSGYASNDVLTLTTGYGWILSNSSISITPGPNVTVDNSCSNPVPVQGCSGAYPVNTTPLMGTSSSGDVPLFSEDGYSLDTNTTQLTRTLNVNAQNVISSEDGNFGRQISHNHGMLMFGNTNWDGEIYFLGSNTQGSDGSGQNVLRVFDSWGNEMPEGIIPAGYISQYYYVLDDGYSFIEPIWEGTVAPILEYMFGNNPLPAGFLKFHQENYLDMKLAGGGLPFNIIEYLNFKGNGSVPSNSFNIFKVVAMLTSDISSNASGASDYAYFSLSGTSSMVYWNSPVFKINGSIGTQVFGSKDFLFENEWSDFLNTLPGEDILTITLFFKTGTQIATGLFSGTLTGQVQAQNPLP